jgi:hypothetical protein
MSANGTWFRIRLARSARAAGRAVIAGRARQVAELQAAGVTSLPSQRRSTRVASARRAAPVSGRPAPLPNCWRGCRPNDRRPGCCSIRGDKEQPAVPAAPAITGKSMYLIGFHRGIADAKATPSPEGK